MTITLRCLGFPACFVLASSGVVAAHASACRGRHFTVVVRSVGRVLSSRGARYGYA